MRIYADQKPVVLRLADEGFQIFDRADLGRLLVAPEMNGAPEPTRARAQAVAMRFLADGARGACRVSEGNSAAKPFVEVAYRCEKARVASPSTTSSLPKLVPHEGAPREPFALRMNRI